MPAPVPSSAPGPVASPTLLHDLQNIVEPLPLDTIFARPQPLEVELGSGDGSFLAEWARRNPAHNFLGVERLLGRIRKLDRKGRRLGLTNLALVRIEAGYFLRHLLPAASASALHIYFPDPWPKRRHRKHRLVNAAFTHVARQALAPGGLVCLRTDDADYFQQMSEVFTANPAFQVQETPAELAGVITDFEREFNARGVATRRGAWQRIA